MRERRRFPRFESAVQIKYYPQGNDSQFSYTLSNDISKGGISMPALSGVVNKGDIINLDIIAGDKKEHISATGKVKWIKPLNRIAPLDEEMGIEFISADPSGIDKLIKVIRSRLLQEHFA
jgi:c-di-GMP-binding flagellar brake protein YcgR